MLHCTGLPCNALLCSCVPHPHSHLHLCMHKSPLPNANCTTTPAAAALLQSPDQQCFMLRFQDRNMDTIAQAVQEASGLSGPRAGQWMSAAEVADISGRSQSELNAVKAFVARNAGSLVQVSATRWVSSSVIYDGRCRLNSTSFVCCTFACCGPLRLAVLLLPAPYDDDKARQPAESGCPG